MLENDLRALARTGGRWLAVVMIACGAFMPALHAATPLPLDSNIELLTSGQVEAMVWQPDGGLVIGGYFRSINGKRHANLARFRPDGTLDDAWNASVDSTVTALAIAEDGAVYVAGNFHVANGEARASLAKFASDGTLDAAWAPQANDSASSLAIGTGGAVYAGGYFTSIGGVARNRIAKLDPANGSVDPLWNPSANNFVSVLAVDTDGSVFAGGGFTNIGGQPRGHIAKLDGAGTGAAFPSWSPIGGNDRIDALALDGAGHLYAGGYFTTFAGFARNRLVRLDAGGTGALDTTWNPAPNGGVTAIAIAPDGFVFIAGGFYQAGGGTTSSIAKLSPSGPGAADPTWQGSIGGVSRLALDGSGRLHVGGYFNAVATVPRLSYARLDSLGHLADEAFDVEKVAISSSLAVMPDGHIMIGGWFQKVGQQNFRYLIRLNSDLTLDTTWHLDTNGYPDAMLPAADGSLYVAGSFGYIDGFSSRKFAKLGPDGSVDPVWNPAVAMFSARLAWAADGDIFVAGTASSQPALVKVSASGTGDADPAWHPSFDGLPSDMATDASGALFVAGNFTHVDGVARQSIAKFRADATLDPDWNPAPDLAVSKLAMDASGNAIYAGGTFHSIGGAARQSLAKLDTGGIGAADPAWDPASSFAGVSALLVANDSLYVGGGSMTFGGIPRGGLARLSRGDAVLDPAWDPELASWPYQLAASGDGVLYATGDIGSSGGIGRDGFVALPATTLQATTITITSIDPEPSLVGESYTVSFVVDSAIGTPTGTVSLFDHIGGTCDTELVDGAGTCVLAGPPAAGEVSVKAVYRPDDDTFTESETEKMHEVVRAATTIVLSPGGVSVATEPVHFFANLGSLIDVDGGTVTIGDGESSCTAEVVFFTAACDVIFAHAGVHEVTATYSGDDEHEPAVSAPETQTVTAAPTSLEIVSHTPNPSIPGQPVTVTVDLALFGGAIGPATGQISIDVAGGGPSCTIVLPATHCDIVLAGRGSQILEALYPGNDDFSVSTASVEHSVNQLPIANDDAATINEDQPLIVNATNGVLANDVDPDGDTLVVADPGPRTADGIGGNVVLFYDGSYEYTPPPDANGDATFEYTLTDGLEDAIAPATVTIHVRPVNDPPAFSLASSPHFGAGPPGLRQTPGFATMTSSGPGESDHVLAWHVRTIADPSGVLSGAATIALDGTLSTPLSGEAGTATLAVSLQDDGGTDNGGDDTSAEQTFTVTVDAGTDLSVSIFDGTDFLAGGGSAIYEITVRNVGGENVTSARATIGASANLSGLEWTCEAFDGATCTASGAGIVSDTLSLPAGSSAVYELTANVAANPELPAEVTASIAVLTGPADFDPANDSAHDVDAVCIFQDGFDPPRVTPGR